MSSHWDYGPDKTKAERRERGKEKKRERQAKGKKIKLLFRLSMERAVRAAVVIAEKMKTDQK